MTFLKPFLVSLALLCPLAASGQTSAQTDGFLPPHDFMINNQPLTADELKAAFHGITHDGYYTYESQRAETPNFRETTFKSGRVKHVQGSETILGDWAVKGDEICYTYDYKRHRPLCFNIYRVGNCYYHYLLNDGGEWTAKSTPRGERPTCEAFVS